MASSGKVYKKCVEQRRCASEKCDHPWYCHFSKNGVRYRMSIPEAFGVNPMKRTEAKSVWLPKFVNEINEAIREGRDPFAKNTIDTNVLTVAEFIDKHYVPRYYQAETIADIDSPDGRSKVKLLRRDLGELRLAQLESEVVVDDYKKKLEASGVGIAGRNRRLSKLRQMLNWAKDWKFITRVPFSRNLVSLDIDQEVGRERRLEPGEEAQLLKAADAEMKLRIIAALDRHAQRRDAARAAEADRLQERIHHVAASRVDEGRVPAEHEERQAAEGPDHAAADEAAEEAALHRIRRLRLRRRERELRRGHQETVGHGQPRGSRIQSRMDRRRQPLRQIVG